MIPLMVRSHYSLMQGTASPQELCRAARQRGYTHLALTDTNNLYGLWPFLAACRQYGLKPIVGAEVTGPCGGRNAICLVKDAAGFRSLCRLLSQRHRDPEFSLAAAVGEHQRGLLVLTSSAALLEAWQRAGVDLAVALPGWPGGGGRALRRLAGRLGLPLVAVPDSFFLDPADWRLHRLLRAIALSSSLSRLDPAQVAPPGAWLAPAAEYRRRFAAWPQAIAASRQLAGRLAFSGPEQGTIMPPWSDPQGRSADQVLRQRAYQGARRRYGTPLSPAVRRRLEHELAVIAGKNFSSYFLVVHNIVKRSPRICGRGSGAASLVAYALGITNVCPLKFNLYFERFINPQRRDPPDIDVDFAWDERDQIRAALLAQYSGRAAMVCNQVLFQGRMAIREVAKVFGLPAREIKLFMKRLPWLRGPAEEDTGLYPKRKALPAGVEPRFAEPWPQILRLAQRIVGAPRNLSVHSGGVVITPGPIEDYVPVETAPKGVPIIQWEKDGAEDAGLVKIDLLGNRSLGVIRDAIKNLRQNGEPFDEAGWEPEDDPATQGLVARGRTMGCFYIESPAMRLLQQKAAKGDFEHLVIHSSIIRPAANDFIQEYLRRLQGGAWSPIHPLLKGILAETLGIMVYQEDVSRTAVVLAGFSHAEADGLRKVMSRKDKTRALRDYRRKFADGARARGVSRAQIEEIWRMMLSFSGYSFCKPHSASYARVSFQAAYLKAHFPAEFMAAVISNQGGFYSTFAYVSEARRLGLKLLPPDINQAQVRWQGQDGSLRVGLMAIKDLAVETQKRIVAQRQQRPFAGFDDFWQRVRPDQREVRALIHAGAFDSLYPGQDHAELLWRLARRSRQRAAVPAAAGDLFAAVEPAPMPYLPPGDGIERLRQQYRVLGFLLERHPMVLFAGALKGAGVIKARDLARHQGRRVKVAGWLITGKTVSSKHHEPMQFLTFEDETALVETTFFPRAYRRFSQNMDWNRPYLLSGLVEENFGANTLTVERARAI